MMQQELKDQAEFGRKGLQMIQTARDLLEVDMKSFAQAKDFKDINDLLVQVFQRFLNRVDAVLAGVRDENDVMFKAGVPWTQASEKEEETARQ